MRKASLFVQSPMAQVSDLSQPPLLFPSVPSTFYDSIGDLIVSWGLMEQQMNILIWALLKHNGNKEEKWRTSGFDRRNDLLEFEWRTFSKGFPKLESFLKEPTEKIRIWKTLRDAISHKEMILGAADDGNHFIQFYNKSRAKQKTKPYYKSDFKNGAKDALASAGWFYWVCQNKAVWPLPYADTLHLRLLPNKDQLRLPT